MKIACERRSDVSSETRHSLIILLTHQLHVLHVQHKRPVKLASADGWPHLRQDGRHARPECQFGTGCVRHQNGTAGTDATANLRWESGQTQTWKHCITRVCSPQTWKRSRSVSGATLRRHVHMGRSRRTRRRTRLVVLHLKGGHMELYFENDLELSYGQELGLQDRWAWLSLTYVSDGSPATRSLAGAHHTLAHLSFDERNLTKREKV